MPGISLLNPAIVKQIKYSEVSRQVINLDYMLKVEIETPLWVFQRKILTDEMDDALLEGQGYTQQG